MKVTLIPWYSILDTYKSSFCKLRWKGLISVNKDFKLNKKLLNGNKLANWDQWARPCVFVRASLGGAIRTLFQPLRCEPRWQWKAWHQQYEISCSSLPVKASSIFTAQDKRQEKWVSKESKCETYKQAGPGSPTKSCVELDINFSKLRQIPSVGTRSIDSISISNIHLPINHWQHGMVEWI